MLNSKSLFEFRIIAIILGLVALVYGNIYGNQFIFDDEFLIQKNSYLLDWSGFFKAFTHFSTSGSGGVDQFYRPMQVVFYFPIYQFFGLEPWAFHLPGLFLHLGNVALIYFLGRELGLSLIIRASLALIWGVHPIHTEAVTYMSATADTGSTFFILLGIFFFAKRIRSNAPIFWLVVCNFAFLGALLFKESAVVFPALLVAFALGMAPSENLKKSKFWIQGTGLSWGIAVIYFGLRKWALGVNFYRTSNIYTENILYRIYTALATLPHYFELLLVPHDLHMERSFSIYTSLLYSDPMIGLCIALTLLVLTFLAIQKKWNLFLCGVLWFLFAQSPHTGILLPVNSFFLEHWMYLPSIGILWILGFWVNTFTKSKKIFLFVAGLVSIIYGVCTWSQNTVWMNPITFYSHILRYEPQDARAHNNYAMALADAGLDTEAIQHYRAEMALTDTYPQTHHNLALVLLRQRKISEAILEFEKALNLEADFFQSSAKLAEVYQSLGDSERAARYLEMAKISIEKRSQ